jgi:hypothetical protein
MVFFNDPLPVAEHELQAIRLALAAQERFRGLAAGWRKRGIELSLGVGIAAGHATLGRIGFEGRYDYGALGPVTNLASRLSTHAAAGQVLISQRVFAAVEGTVAAQRVGEIELKGSSRDRFPPTRCSASATPSNSHTGWTTKRVWSGAQGRCGWRAASSAEANTNTKPRAALGAETRVSVGGRRCREGRRTGHSRWPDLLWCNTNIEGVRRSPFEKATVLQALMHGRLKGMRMCHILELSTHAISIHPHASISEDAAQHGVAHAGSRDGGHEDINRLLANGAVLADDTSIRDGILGCPVENVSLEQDKDGVNEEEDSQDREDRIGRRLAESIGLCSATGDHEQHDRDRQDDHTPMEGRDARDSSTIVKGLSGMEILLYVVARHQLPPRACPPARRLGTEGFGADRL